MIIMMIVMLIVMMRIMVMMTRMILMIMMMMYMFAYVVKDSVGGHVQVGTIALLPRLEGVGLWAGRERLRRGKWDCVWGGNVCSVV